MTLPSASAESRTAQLRRVTLSSLLGTAIEYYDFMLYSTMAAVALGRLFFPSSNPTMSTIGAFGTLAAGYLARPLGGLVFGHFGDRLGRKSTLITTMVLMGGASFLVGVLPVYHSIGIMAPILLVLCRMVQGVAVGGEWGGAMLMVVEQAARERRGWWTGIIQLGSPIGFLLATFAVMMVNLLPRNSFYSWGWRLPFLSSALLLIIGLYLRLNVVESEVFRRAAEEAKASAQQKVPALRVLRQPRTLVLACAAGIGPFLLNTLANTQMIAYATGIGYRTSDVMRALIVTSTMSIVFVPLFSALSDKCGRRTVILWGAVGAVLYALPLYALVDTRSVALMTAGLIVAQIIAQLMFAPLAPLLSEMFGTAVRYTGVSLAYQVASLIGAGLTPLMASTLVAVFGGSSLPLSVAMAVAAMVTMVAVWRTAETRGRDLEADSEFAAR
jgi:MFS family permease